MSHQPDIVDLPGSRFADMLSRIMTAQERLALPPLEPLEHPDLEAVDEELLPLPGMLDLDDDADPIDNTWQGTIVPIPPEPSPLFLSAPEQDDDEEVSVLDETHETPYPLAMNEPEMGAADVDAMLQEVLAQMAALQEEEQTDQDILVLDDSFEVPGPDTEPSDDEIAGLLVEDVPEDEDKDEALSVEAPRQDDLLTLDDISEPPGEPTEEEAESTVESLLQDVLAKMASLRRDGASAPEVPEAEPLLTLDEDDVIVPEPVPVIEEELVLTLDEADVIVPEAEPEVPEAELQAPGEELVLTLHEDDVVVPEQVIEQASAPDIGALLQDVLNKMSGHSQEPPEEADLAEEAQLDALVAEENDNGVLLLDQSFEAIPEPPAIDQAAEPPPVPARETAEDDDLSRLLQGVLSKMTALDSERPVEAASPSPPPPSPPVQAPPVQAPPVQAPPAPTPPIAEDDADLTPLLEGVLTKMALGEAPASLPASDAAIPAAPSAKAPEAEEDVLVLDDSFAAEVPPEPPMPEPAPVAPEPPPAQTMEELQRLIEVTTPPGTGTLDLPERLDALAKLLNDTPNDDFQSLDLLYTCWPKGTVNCTSRALLAVANRLAHNFGVPGEKLPMATSKAWRMLDPTLFEFSMATRLGAIGEFIVNWQKTQKIFLVLEFAEIELIEFLFESLHPADHQAQLSAVMNFKVLSNRRLGLLRRIPGRARKSVESMLATDREGAMVQLAHYKALLERIGDPNGFAPIVEAAGRAVEEVEKHMKQIAGPPPGGPPGGGMALGRIG